MGIDIRKRVIESSKAAEIYITISPSEIYKPEEFAREAFTAIREALAPANVKIVHERVFGTPAGLQAAQKVRSGIYGELDDGVAPTYLVCKESASGIIAGIQIHAMRTGEPVEAVSVEEVACGRVVRSGKNGFLTLSGISDSSAPSAQEQARAMLEKAEAVLEQYGGSIASVTRTWMWLGDILAWYDEFNRVRNAFLAQVGAIGKGKKDRMPASTGIGLGPVNGCQCSMDLAAVLGPNCEIEYLQATDKQKSALEYGSAFSRAASVRTPGGRTVYVSGTASIDAAGTTTNINDAEGQIRETIENVRAALHDMGCHDKDVVQSTAYAKCKTAEQVFKSLPESKLWPTLTMVCDICRDDLLFEIEATAMKSQN